MFSFKHDFLLLFLSYFNVFCLYQSVIHVFLIEMLCRVCGHIITLDLSVNGFFFALPNVNILRILAK